MSDLNDNKINESEEKSNKKIIIIVIVALLLVVGAIILLTSNNSKSKVENIIVNANVKDHSFDKADSYNDKKEDSNNVENPSGNDDPSTPSPEVTPDVENPVDKPEVTPDVVNPVETPEVTPETTPSVTKPADPTKAPNATSTPVPTKKVDNKLTPTVKPELTPVKTPAAALTPTKQPVASPSPAVKPSSPTPSLTPTKVPSPTPTKAPSPTPTKAPSQNNQVRVSNSVGSIEKITSWEGHYKLSLNFNALESSKVTDKSVLVITFSSTVVSISGEPWGCSAKINPNDSKSLILTGIKSWSGLNFESGENLEITKAYITY